MRESECIEVKHRRNTGETSMRWKKNGWKVESYKVAGHDIWIKNYLLF
jgi:hypothetical protein